MIDYQRQQWIASSIEPPEFEGYQIVRRLGIGAASVIYAIRNKKNGEMRALKHVIRREGEDKRMLEQVENEFVIASKVDHPYIRKVYDLKRIKKRLQVREIMLLMEYCPGISLEQSPSRSLVDLLLIFRMVANGLHGMHNVGLVHCDMKPNNIIIAENGGIRIIDLGQSCAMGTVKPRIQGTPDYIAPEQVKRKPMTRQTDIFNLGATLYWALTGKNIPTMIPRQSSRNGVELMDSRMSGPPPTPTQLKPKIPQGISNLVMDCVKDEAASRPADMLAVISRLDMLIHMIAGDKLAANVQK